MLETDIAYIAGFFDGEGNVGTYFHNQRGTDKINISITQSSRDILFWIRDSLGYGSVYFKSRDSRTGNRASCWMPTRWDDSLAFLKLIEPYVRVKRIDVERGIQFLESRINKRDEIKERRENSVRKAFQN